MNKPVGIEVAPKYIPKEEYMLDKFGNWWVKTHAHTYTRAEFYKRKKKKEKK